MARLLVMLWLISAIIPTCAAKPINDTRGLKDSPKCTYVFGVCTLRLGAKYPTDRCWTACEHGFYNETDSLIAVMSFLKGDYELEKKVSCNLTNYRHYWKLRDCTISACNDFNVTCITQTPIHKVNETKPEQAPSQDHVRRPSPRHHWLVITPVLVLVILGLTVWYMVAKNKENKQTSIV